MNLRKYYEENYFTDYDGSTIPDQCETLQTVTVGQIKELLNKIDSLEEDLKDECEEHIETIKYYGGDLG